MKLRIIVILLMFSALYAFGMGKKDAATEPVDEQAPVVQTEEAADDAAVPADTAADNQAETEVTGLPEGAVALVNGAVIEEDDFDREFLREKQNIIMQGGMLNEELEAELKVQIIDSLVQRELLLQESRNQGVQVLAEDVQAEFDKYKADFPDEETFQTAMSEQGYTEERLLSEIEDYLYITAYINEKVYEAVAVSTEDVQDFYDSNPEYFIEPVQVRARHILITFGDEAERTREEAVALAESIRKDLIEGADFAEQAALYSECPSSAQGGDLGFFSKGQMVPEFEEAVFAIEPGTISDVVETYFGFHIIEVTDKTDETPVPIETVYEMIESYLKQEKTMQRISELITELKDKSEIITR